MYGCSPLPPKKKKISWVPVYGILELWIELGSGNELDLNQRLEEKPYLECDGFENQINIMDSWHVYGKGIFESNKQKEVIYRLSKVGMLYKKIKLDEIDMQWDANKWYTMKILEVW